MCQYVEPHSYTLLAMEELKMVPVGRTRLTIETRVSKAVMDSLNVWKYIGKVWCLMLKLETQNRWNQLTNNDIDFRQ